MPEHRLDRLSAADALRALFIYFERNKDRHAKSPSSAVGVQQRQWPA
jgi:hypothetical protein